MNFWSIIERESIYLLYYFDIQFRQIFWYWVLGILIGSAISVFVKNQIHSLAEFLGKRLPGIAGWIFASLLGIASPLCMYGTIPICAAFSKKGVKDDFLASFMMSSILLNPQLIIYSTALGVPVVLVRILSCFICGVISGLCVKCFLQFKVKNSKNKVEFKNIEENSRIHDENEEIHFFDFSSFESKNHNRDTDKNILIRYLKNVGRNIKATGPMFLLGILLSAIFQRYVPSEAISKLFGKNEGFGVLMAATIGVPLYVCGGGTIPLLLDWLNKGMTVGSAASFMITGPATKITNLGALKIVLGLRRFLMYILFVVIFSLITGLIINLIF